MLDAYAQACRSLPVVTKGVADVSKLIAEPIIQPVATPVLLKLYSDSGLEFLQQKLALWHIVRATVCNV